MADTTRREPPEAPREGAADTNELERDRIRSSNDRDQAVEREGGSTTRTEGYDAAVTGRDVDPDSAESEVDRDDM